MLVLYPTPEVPILGRLLDNRQRVTKPRRNGHDTENGSCRHQSILSQDYCGLSSALAHAQCVLCYGCLGYL